MVGLCLVDVEGGASCELRRRDGVSCERSGERRGERWGERRGERGQGGDWGMRRFGPLTVLLPGRCGGAVNPRRPTGSNWLGGSGQTKNSEGEEIEALEKRAPTSSGGLEGLLERGATRDVPNVGKRVPLFKFVTKIPHFRQEKFIKNQRF
jgi:hypothetical protein